MKGASTPLGAIVAHGKVIVCCGAGGVGKTTTAASLGLAAARLGRRVLVLTIDPSRRLAETLGVARNPPAPVPLPDALSRAAGIAAPGHLDAWMLDPKVVADEAVRRLAGTDERARQLLGNRIYQQATTMVASMHEYTAMKALHRFVSEDHYDLIVLDTPPSRNALDFLDAPKRLAGLLDGAILNVFLRPKTGLVNRAASRLVKQVLNAVFGEQFAAEFAAFIESSAAMVGSLSTELRQMRERLARPDVAFLLVTSPSEAAIVEAHFFHERVLALGLPFRGFILNRSQADTGRVFPEDGHLPPDTSPALRTGLEKLKRLARAEFLRSASDRGLLADLALRAGTDAFAMAFPDLPAGASDIGTLIRIAELIRSERRSGPR